MPDKPLFNERRQLRIDEVFVFIVEDDEGEGIPTFINANRFPLVRELLVAADAARVDSLTRIAQRLKQETGMKIKLVRFSHRQEIKEI